MTTPICEGYNTCGRRAVTAVDGVPMCQRCWDFDTAQNTNDAFTILSRAGLFEPAIDIR